MNWVDDTLRDREAEREAAEPGYKARVVRERLVRIAAIVEHYGSANAALEMSCRDRAILRNPVPCTFKEAKAEYDYWLARRDEMSDVLNDYVGDHFGGSPVEDRFD